jgi:hypothetical protein
MISNPNAIPMDLSAWASVAAPPDNLGAWASRSGMRPRQRGYGSGCWAGTSAVGATCPGGACGTLTPSGSRRSCCSRPASRWWWSATRLSWRAFLPCFRWRWPPKRRCWRCGAAWATIAARECCTRRRSLWPTASRAIFRKRGRVAPAAGDRPLHRRSRGQHRA